MWTEERVMLPSTRHSCISGLLGCGFYGLMRGGGREGGGMEGVGGRILFTHFILFYIYLYI